MKWLNLDQQNLYGDVTEQAAQTLHQVADLCRRTFGFVADPFLRTDSFSCHTENRRGVLAAHGQKSDEGIIVIRFELARIPATARSSIADLLGACAQLGERVRLLPPAMESDGSCCIQAGIQIKAEPLGLSRETALLGELQNLDKLATLLQDSLPLTSYESLAQMFEKCTDILAPVLPLADTLHLPSLEEWASTTSEFLTCSLNVALVAPSPALGDLALASLASVLMKQGSSLGRLSASAMPAKGLVELAQRAPGVVSLPAASLNLAMNPYEITNEVPGVLASLSQLGRPAVFTGSFAQLQSVFHGGQGGGIDPLNPVIRRAPEGVPLELLARFSVRRTAQQKGGLSAGELDKISGEVLEALGQLPQEKQEEAIASLAWWGVNHHAAGSSRDISFPSRLADAAETFSGLSPAPRARRPASVQERYTRLLSDETAMLAFFSEQVVGQDQTLRELCRRLSAEALGRPLHQSLRFCCQGTPGTGKSASAALLARALGVPFVNIDAAGVTDQYSAGAMLLGSGRGIVMSHQPGKLEQAAKHHSGCVMEVSDLDHAPPVVRSYMADIFLQLLETGEAQSATGGLFTCSNLILVFTFNLPDGMDERLRRGIGFGGVPSRGDVKLLVRKELLRMFSPAFFSRMGEPIIFDPLDGPAVAAIIERELRTTIEIGCARLHFEVEEILLEKGLGEKVIASLDADLLSGGARVLIAHARSLATEALLELAPSQQVLRLEVVALEGNKIIIKAQRG